MPSSDSQEIGERIAVNVEKFREAAGLRQDELAAMVGVTQASISRFERGKRLPSADSIARLAAALGVSYEDIVGEPPADRTVARAIALARAGQWLQLARLAIEAAERNG